MFPEIEYTKELRTLLYQIKTNITETSSVEEVKAQYDVLKKYSQSDDIDHQDKQIVDQPLYILQDKIFARAAQTACSKFPDYETKLKALLPVRDILFEFKSNLKATHHWRTLINVNNRILGLQGIVLLKKIQESTS